MLPEVRKLDFRSMRFFAHFRSILLQKHRFYVLFTPAYVQLGVKKYKLQELSSKNRRNTKSKRTLAIVTNIGWFMHGYVEIRPAGT